MDLRCLTLRSSTATWMFLHMYLLGFCRISASPLSKSSCSACCTMSCGHIASETNLLLYRVYKKVHIGKGVNRAAFAVILLLQRSVPIYGELKTVFHHTLLSGRLAVAMLH